jgi:hypothetical protein
LCFHVRTAQHIHIFDSSDELLGQPIVSKQVQKMFAPVAVRW